MTQAAPVAFNGPLTAGNTFAPDVPDEGVLDAELEMLGVREDRRRTIAGIRRLNPTAAPDFLAQFETAALRDYLEHLRHRRHKRVQLTGWLKRRSDRLATLRRAA